MQGSPTLSVGISDAYITSLHFQIGIFLRQFVFLLQLLEISIGICLIKHFIALLAQCLHFVAGFAKFRRNPLQVLIDELVERRLIIMDLFIPCISLRDHVLYRVGCHAVIPVVRGFLMSKPSIDFHENTFAAVFDLIGCQHIFRLSKRLIQILMQSFWRQYFTIWHDRSVVNHDITAIVLATTPYKIAGSVGGRYVAILEISVASRLHLICRNLRSIC